MDQVSRLYREFGPVAYRRCLRLLGNREAAEDAVQEIFTRLLRDVDKLRDRETLVPWIYRVATNHCLNVRREAWQRARTPTPEAIELRAGDDRADGYLEREITQRVLSRFDALTQSIAVGVLVDGMEQEEVARALGISRRTACRKLSLFLRRARKLLATVEPSRPIRPSSLDPVAIAVRIQPPSFSLPASTRP
jgi:RNA polymerase sigma-70 factor (ECF subfamily)